jgi:3-phenylpropionate/cinnamic acid dioxygenase small subunit
MEKRDSRDDHQMIADLCVRYAFALDNRDWAALRECFTPNVTSVYHGVGALEGYDAIETLCRGALEQLDASQHLLGNHLVEVDGDAARATCYFQAEHVRSGTPGGDNFTVAGRYDDRLVRVGEGWKIAHRQQTVQWMNGNSAVLAM